MNVFVLDPLTINPSATEVQRGAYVDLIEFARKDKFGRHQVTDSPEQSHFVIAPIAFDVYGSFFRELRRSRLYKNYKYKFYAYCGDDNVYPSLPGVYPAVTSQWARRKWAAAGHYISSHYRKHEFRPHENPAKRDLLFSFLGSSRTHPIRAEVIRLHHPQGFIFDSNPKREEKPWWERSADEVQQMFQQFKETMERTKFALCPRGVSPSSVRLFEAMEAGCVPVIIADDLVLPTGPDWSRCSVSVSEKDVANIPMTLEKLEPRFSELSAAARRTWEDFFSPQSTFNTLVDWIVDLNESVPPNRRRILELSVRAGEYLKPKNLRTQLRCLIRGR